MKRTIPMIVLLAASCAPAPPPIAVTPASAPVCEAMRPVFPLPQVSYDSKADTPATVASARKANTEAAAASARFKAACN